MSEASWDKGIVFMNCPKCDTINLIIINNNNNGLKKKGEKNTYQFQLEVLWSGYWITLVLSAPEIRQYMLEWLQSWYYLYATLLDVSVPSANLEIPRERFHFKNIVLIQKDSQWLILALLDTSQILSKWAMKMYFTVSYTSTYSF